MRNLFKRFLEFLKSKKRKPVPIPVESDKDPTAGEIIEEKTQRIENVVLIAGHESGGGMRTYNGYAENEINMSLVSETIKRLGTYKKNVFQVTRKHRSYKKYLKYLKHDMQKLNIDLSKTLVIELHLNDADAKTARGLESLVIDEKSCNIASVFGQIFSSTFKIKLRGNFLGNKGVRERASGDGSGFLKTIESLGASSFIWEPFFAGTRSSESSQFLDDKIKGLELMSNFLSERIRSVLQ